MIEYLIYVIVLAVSALVLRRKSLNQKGRVRRKTPPSWQMGNLTMRLQDRSEALSLLPNLQETWSQMELQQNLQQVPSELLSVTFTEKTKCTSSQMFTYIHHEHECHIYFRKNERCL